MSDSNLPLGIVIAYLRKAAGISQEELAERADIHRTYVSQLERGLKSPTLNTLFKISVALGVPASRIVTLVEDERDGL
jgi:transcriptional regulator with XRE-family HTH domain